MFRNMIEQYKKGVEYRKAKYGTPETFYESYLRARKHVEWERENIKPKTRFYWPWTKESDDYCKEIDSFKSHFAYWDEWTGSRYERVENPDQSRVTDMYSVCRSCPVTGTWYSL